MGQFGSENILPYNREEQKGVQIRRMFDAIAGKYDVLNHTLSFGFDKRWRRRGIRFLLPSSPKQILDVATGTGDLAIAMQKQLHAERIIGADISEKMMAEGIRKVKEAGLQARISFEYQDCAALAFADNTFDAVTAAFGVRNFENIKKGLREMYRVTKPGGHVMILELSTPESFPMKQLYRLYSKAVIPAVGRFVSKEKAAYDYLPASVQAVPQGKVMTGLLAEVGYKEAEAHALTFGICSLYTGTK